MNYSPHLLGVSDYVANNIADRLIDEVARLDRKVIERGMTLDPKIMGSMRNVKSQERTHLRLVKQFDPLVVHHTLQRSGGQAFQSCIASLTEAQGWVMSEAHRAVGIRLDVVYCKGRNKPLKPGAAKVAVIDRHVLVRLIQRAGLTDYEALLEMIKCWADAFITDDIEMVEMGDWLCKGNKRVLLPIVFHGEVCAIMTEALPGLNVKHPVLRAVTLFTNEMLTADEDRLIAKLVAKPVTRMEMVKALPRRTGHLTRSELNER